jgi:hypothetical protein
MQWVTTARPHVDRCATAWLLKRFVDKDATFAFVTPGAPLPPKATPFDLPGTKHGHHDDDCTFETVVKLSKLEKDAGLAGVARIVHDLDMHQMKRAESAGLDAILKGLVLAELDDHRVLERAFSVFDALYTLESARAGAAAP